MNFNTFNSRETYKAARVQWKAQYKQLSLDIRKAKTDFKEAQRALDKVGVYDYRWRDELKNTWNAANRVLMTTSSTVFILKISANEALQSLAEAKIEAARQYLEAKVNLEQA